MQDIIIKEKTLPPFIDYEVTAKKITFGEDELTVNVASRERDYEVQLDICIDSDGGIVIGTGGSAQRYAAQIIIPAKRYEMKPDGEDEEGRPKEKPVPVPFDMSRCTLVLWGLEG